MDFCNELIINTELHQGHRFTANLSILREFFQVLDEF